MDCPCIEILNYGSRKWENRWMLTLKTDNTGMDELRTETGLRWVLVIKTATTWRKKETLSSDSGGWLRRGRERKKGRDQKGKIKPQTETWVSPLTRTEVRCYLIYGGQANLAFTWRVSNKPKWTLPNKYSIIDSGLVKFYYSTASLMEVKRFFMEQRADARMYSAAPWVLLTMDVLFEILPAFLQTNGLWVWQIQNQYLSERSWADGKLKRSIKKKKEIGKGELKLTVLVLQRW